jgi:1-acylglycerone phosphate reductase
LYAASKRSLELVSEALRLEMVPLGVKVVTLVTGAVKSQGQTHFGDFKLPPTSKYLAIEDAIANRARGGDGFARMDTEKYAEHVVKDVLQGATGRLWVGNTATVTKWASALLPDSLIVSSALLLYIPAHPADGRLG